MIRRSATGWLAAFVQTLWASDAPAGVGLERVLPTGAMHVVLRLSSTPLVMIEGEQRRTLSRAIVGGARTSFYVRDVSSPTVAVGAQLRPGASMALFGVPAGVLAEAHTALEDLWGAETEHVRDRIASAGTLAGALACFEAELSRRVVGADAMHPVVADAVRRLAFDPRVSIGALAERSGYSHRRFIGLFRDAVGLGPASHRRVMRVGRALGLLARGPAIVRVADAAGFADQAHLTRELVAITGLSPVAYRAVGAPSHHVPMSGGQIRSRRATTRTAG